MNIRKFQELDRDSLVDLWGAVFPDNPTHNEPSNMLRAKLAVDDLIFVAEHNGKLIGACMAGYDGVRGWLYSVAVLDEQRRCGAGSALVNYALQCLKDIGCVKVNLQLCQQSTDAVTF